MQTPLQLLFLCTHNRCRSILSEAITNARGDGRVVARSAGVAAENQVHPLTLRYLAQAGYATEGLRSKSWDEFQGDGAYAPDVVVTVCNTAKNEACPVWLAPQPKVHWYLNDPSKVEGADQEKAAAFMATITEIERRTDALLALPLRNANPAQIAAAMQGLIGTEAA